MTPWQWFVARGDDMFLFIAAAAAAIQSDPQLGLSTKVVHWVMLIGLLAGVAHKILLPNQQGPTAPKAP